MRRSSWILALGLGFAIAGCVSSGPTHVELAPVDCRPDFSDRGGWYGGDVATSIPLGEGEDRPRLWLFGDTFVERAAAPGRRAYPFVSNSVGVSRCDRETGWQFTAYWDAADLAEPRGFFRPDAEADWVAESLARSGRPPWYWPLAGFAHEGAIYVGLLRVEAAEAEGAFRLPFRSIGVDLAIVREPSGTPADWEIELVALSDASTLFPVSAFVVHAAHVHAVAFLDRGDGQRPRSLVRWPLRAFVQGTEDLGGLVETLDREGRWQPGLDPVQAAILFERDATEMSLYADPTRDRFIAIAMEPGTTTIRRRIAERLTGPWSEPETIHEIEPPAVPNGAGASFCYAAKAHPGLAPPDRLWLTWVCSRFARSPDEDLPVLRSLLEHEALYRPTAAEVAAPR